MKRLLRRKSSESKDDPVLGNKDHTEDPCDGLSFSVGVSETKNGKFRRTMEDVHTYVANFAERLDWGYFAVFDGHAGKETARWAGAHLHEMIYDSIQREEFADLRETLNTTFINADKEIASLNGVGQSGATAAVAVLRWEVEGDPTNNTNDDNNCNANEDQKFDFIPTEKHKRMLYTANAGDSKIVLSRGGKPHCLTYEHKATDRNEIKRISQSGGLVLGGRVNGILAVTRSLGDVALKEWVIGAPYTTSVEITKDDEYVIIGCDGLWDVCSDLKAVSLCKGLSAQEAANGLVAYALGNNTTDNVTVLVVKLNPGVFPEVAEGQTAAK